MEFLNLLTIDISLVGSLRLLQTSYKKKGGFYSPPPISLFFAFLSPSHSLLSSPFFPPPSSPFLSPLSLTPSATHRYCGVLNSIYFKVTEMPVPGGVLTHADHRLRASECSYWHWVLLLSEIMVFCLLVYFRVGFLWHTSTFSLERSGFSHVSIDYPALGWGRHVCTLKTRFRLLPISTLLTEKRSSVSLHVFLFGVCFLSHWFNLRPCNCYSFTAYSCFTLCYSWFWFVVFLKCYISLSLS